ncbi:MAG: MBL fold metallo-hydrolase [Phycisphaerales bacterium]|nr:MBL fold metallo-hydrolase [Phycisphaerales bacterium]
MQPIHHRATRLLTAAFASTGLLTACTREIRIEQFDATPATESKSAARPGTAIDGSGTIALTALQQAPLEIHFIKVGQGDCTLVKCPNGKNVLVDCGSLKEAHPLSTRNYLRDHLDQMHIDTLVVTHPDADHYNMIPYSLAPFTIGRIVMIGDPSEYDATAYVTSASQKSSHGFENWLSHFDPSKVTVVDQDDIDESTAADHALFDTGEVDIYIVAAEIDDPGNLSPVNTRSIVLMVSFDEFDCLLTGDATFPTEDAIIAKYPADWLDVDVLKLGHHGSRVTSTSPVWANTVKPEVCIASAAYTKMHGHPSHDLRERLEPHTDTVNAHKIRWWNGKDSSYNLSDYKEATYSTARSGTIVVKSDGQTFSVLYSE